MTPFLIIGVAIRFLMKRYAVDLPDVEKQAGPPNQGADFSWELGATKNKARLSWRPYASGNSIGSSKRRDQDTTQLLPKDLNHPQRNGPSEGSCRGHHCGTECRGRLERVLCLEPLLVV